MKETPLLPIKSTSAHMPDTDTDTVTASVFTDMDMESDSTVSQDFTAPTEVLVMSDLDPDIYPECPMLSPLSPPTNEID
jgi:hypothetical protein